MPHQRGRVGATAMLSRRVTVEQWIRLVVESPEHEEVQ